MNKTYESLINRGKSNPRLFQDYAVKLKQINGRKLDALFAEATEEAFTKINCMECANCCRTLGPKLTPPDMTRLASLFKMKASSFRKQYSLLDEDEEFIFKDLPCPFLEENNSCFVYDKRPKACREYPHTDMKHMLGRLKNAARETAYCPAAVLVFDYLAIKLGL